MGAHRFEDLEVRQLARLVTASIYQLTSRTALRREFGLSDQLKRAAVSVMANIAEGFERPSPIDFRRFLMIAKASNAELQSHLYVASDTALLPTEETIRMIQEAKRVTALWLG